MIPKAGAKNFEPTNYRLISLLSGLYLSWSRARFKQLEDWQLAVFPRSLSGGIKGRHAADIYHGIGLQAEQAVAGRDPLVGIKLDGSKCFDRIVPHVVEAFAMKLGCDQRVFVVWRQLYQSFERYLCLGNLVHPSPLENLNGVAQGDCFSVLAINIIMCAWHVVASQITSVTPSCFIDDAYLTSSLNNISMLQRAVQATELFDGLIGQQLNLAKSSSCGSNGTVRKALQNMFPGVPCTEILGVLGAHIKMTRKSTVFDTSSVFHGVKSLLLAIAWVLVGFVHKSFLIAAKAVPTFTFAAELNPVPRLTLDSLTKQVAHALWGDRPCWTCCWVLPATQPGFLHVSFFAATIVCGIARRCRLEQEFCQCWVHVLQVKPIPRCMADSFLNAIVACGLKFVPPLAVQFLDFPPVPLVDLSPKALRPFSARGCFSSCV